MRKPAGLFIFLGLGIYGWIEFEALIFVGNAIGGFLSFIGIFLTAFIGLFLIRKLNKRVFAAWQKDRENNKHGLSKLAEGLSILLGGLLLLIPGYFTDLIGLICMLPFIRTLIGSIIIANFADLRIFSDLRNRHHQYSNNMNDNPPNSPEHTIITIDGDYTEKK